MTDYQRKCPLCNGGTMVRSRSSNSGYTFYFWKKPWKLKLFDFGVERVYPWACMTCGVVLLYLDPFFLFLALLCIYRRDFMLQPDARV